MSDFKKLFAYQKGFNLSMEIFEISKGFPKEEIYSLTDQIRRSSRSVCANFGESYRKRRYTNHFISKLTDCDAENAETQVWLHFAFECNYIDKLTFNNLNEKSLEVGRLLNNMIISPEVFMIHK